MSLARPGAPRMLPLRGDVLIVLLLALPVGGSLLVRAVHHGPLAVVLLAPVALAPVFLRRDRPWLALGLALTMTVVLPEDRASTLPFMVVLYTIASRRPWQEATVAGAGAAVVSILAGAAWGGAIVNDRAGLLGYAIGTTASSAAAVALGLYVGARRRVIEGLRERAERLDRERELLAERAVAQERVRIAQELHDIVAHNVSLIVVQAQALGATVDDERVTRGAGAIADLGRQAMSEMHTTLRLLRDDSTDPERSPQPGLRDIERLIEQSRAAGLDVALTVEGEPRPLPHAADLSAFRILQEALTNVIKHAGRARTEVRLAYRPEGLELTVTDNEPADRGEHAPAPAEGHGLIGMRERATLFGGTLSTRALPDGFQVSATLPYAPATP